jgi:hypothetical protein
MGTNDIRSFARELRRNKRSLEREARDITSDVAGGMVFNVKRDIIDNDAVASTELFRSVQQRPYRRRALAGKPVAGRRVEVADEKGALVSFGTGIRGDSLPRLAKAMYGRHRFQAGDPSVGEIMTWMRVKPSFTLPPTWPLAQAIASKIQNEGTPAQPFFMSNWRDAKSALKVQIRGAMKHNLT